MNRRELIDALASKAEVSKKDADKVLAAFTETVSETLKKGDSLQLTGFGTFSTVKRAARKGKNPRTGEAIKIKACVSPKFHAGKALRDAVKK